MTGAWFLRFSCNVKFLLSDCRGRFHNLGRVLVPLAPDGALLHTEGPRHI